MSKTGFVPNGRPKGKSKDAEGDRRFQMNFTAFYDKYAEKPPARREQLRDKTGPRNGGDPNGPRSHGKRKKKAIRFANKLYKSAAVYISKAYEALGKGKNPGLQSGEELVRRIMEVSKLEETLFLLAVHRQYDEGFMYRHPVNAAILAVKLGASMGMDERQLVELGLSALLHDAGSIFIPDEIFHKTGVLTRAELKTIRDRPNLSHKLLRAFRHSHPYLAETAVQVHERVDGTGYPSGLEGEEIHEYAKIIGLVDMYEAMVHDRPHRPRLFHFSAVKEIIGKHKGSFDRSHLKALINVFSLFPLYSYVRLNSGAIGRVIETYPGQPMRPKLKMIFDSRKRKLLTEKIVDLQDNPLLYIVDSVGDHQIARMTE